MKKLRLKKDDIIIFAVILCIGVLFLLCLNLFSADGSVAVVEVDGEIVSQLKLDTDTKYDIVIDGKVTNTVVIDNLTAYVINANCPDKICQNHNPISKNGESIVCLPNKVVVTISGDDNEIDGVVR